MSRAAVLRSDRSSANVPDASDGLVDAVGELAGAWLAKGLPAPSPMFSASRCDVATCRAIPFVRLVTSLGFSTLCLCHYESVKARVRWLQQAQRPPEAAATAKSHIRRLPLTK